MLLQKDPSIGLPTIPGYDAAVPSKYYVEGSGRAGGVEDLFAAIAPRYDLINDLQSLGLHRRWKSRLIRLASIQPGESALDVCCGTGDVAFALARAGARVTGLDFSNPMLEVARRRDISRSMNWLQGDALALPFPDAAFDVVTVAYGLRNMSDVDKGLDELLRVTRPGGRVLILEFGKPPNALWRRLYFAYLRWLVPVFGRLFCGDSDTHAYILDSLIRYPGQQGIRDRLRTRGCTSTDIVNLLGGAMSINLAVKAPLPVPAS